MITARLAKNKFEAEVAIDGKPLPILAASLEYEGKRRVLILRITDFELLPESQCPERERFEQVLQAFGNLKAVAALDTPCHLLQLNPRACNGCPQRPI
jgi:hypothetical protein